MYFSANGKITPTTMTITAAILACILVIAAIFIVMYFFFFFCCLPFEECFCLIILWRRHVICSEIFSDNITITIKVQYSGKLKLQYDQSLVLTYLLQCLSFLTSWQGIIMQTKNLLLFFRNKISWHKTATVEWKHRLLMSQTPKTCQLICWWRKLTANLIFKKTSFPFIQRKDLLRLFKQYLAMTLVSQKLSKIKSNFT